jgi:hypothetical protein
MSEVSQEFPDSILPQANERYGRISRALGHVNKSVQLELSDMALDPALVDDTRQAELNALAQNLIGQIKEGFGLLKDLVETGGIAIEVDERGIPLGLSVSDARPQLEAPPPDEQPVADAPPGAETPEPETDEPVPGAGSTEPPAADETTAEDLGGSGHEDVETAERKTSDLVIGPFRIPADELELSDQESFLLQAISGFENKPISRQMFYEAGFSSNGASESERRAQFNKAISGLITTLENLAGTKVIDRIGNRGGSRYVIKLPFKIGDVEVPVTPENGAASARQSADAGTAEGGSLKKKTLRRRSRVTTVGL